MGHGHSHDVETLDRTVAVALRHRVALLVGLAFAGAATVLGVLTWWPSGDPVGELLSEGDGALAFAAPGVTFPSGEVTFVGEACPDGDVPNGGFSDTSGNTHAAAIDCIVWWELTHGTGPGRYEPMCIGTTTSARMVRFTEPLGRDYGVRAICGKGGFPDEAIEPMQRLGMVYFAIVGGAAALETTQIEEIEEVAWEELMPECLWKFRVKDFGPLWVGIDSHGNSLFHDVQEQAKKKLEELYARL
jgi:L(+)-tartrate dehydratase beta subunit